MLGQHSALRGLFMFKANWSSDLKLLPQNDVGVKINLLIALQHIFASVSETVIRGAVDYSVPWRSNFDQDTALRWLVYHLSCLHLCIAKHVCNGCLAWKITATATWNWFFFSAQRCLKQKTNLVCIMFVRCKKISFRVCRITFEAIFTLPWIISCTITGISYSQSNLYPTMSWLWNKISLSALIQDRCLIFPCDITETHNAWQCNSEHTTKASEIDLNALRGLPSE